MSLYATPTMTKDEILRRAQSELTTVVPMGAGVTLVNIQLLEQVRCMDRGVIVGVLSSEAAVLVDQLGVATRV